MEIAQLILERLSEIGIIVILIVLGIAYKDVVAQKLGFKRNYNDGKPITNITDLASKFGSLENEMFELKEYVNHRQTGMLEEHKLVLNRILEALEKLIKMEEKEHANAQEVRDKIVRIDYVLEDMKDKF